MNKDYEQWKAGFIEKVQARLRCDEDLKDRGNVCVHTFSHVNLGSHEGLVMPELNDSGVSPVVYLDDLYERHQKGMPDEILAQAAVAQFANHRGMEARTKELLNYEKMKEGLRIRVSGLENNRGWMEEKISVVKGDFIHSCYLTFWDDQGDMMTVNVSKSHAEAWKVSPEQVMEDAQKGSMSMEAEMTSVFEVLNQASGTREAANFLAHPELIPEEEMIFILREKESPFGASVIARADVLKQVAEIFDDNYYVLPSSIEEIILIPAKYCDEPEVLNSMVHEINEMMVAPEIKLCDQVQIYDRSRERMMNAVEYRYQKRSQEKMDSEKLMVRRRQIREDYER